MVVPFREILIEVLLGVLDALADSVRNLGSLAEAEADGALAVAYNDQSGELEDTAALNGLGNAVERYNASRRTRPHAYRFCQI